MSAIESSARERLLQALDAVLYVTEDDLTAGDATDLRDLGLDSVRFVLLLRRLEISDRPGVAERLAGDLRLSAVLHELEAPSGDKAPIE